MNIKNIHEHAGWFASYMNASDGGNDAQGEALVECQIKKIKQLTELIENIKGEIILKPIFTNGKILNEDSLQNIRERVNSNI